MSPSSESDSFILFVLIGLFIFLLVLSIVVAIAFPEFVGISKPKNKSEDPVKDSTESSKKN